MDSVAPVCWLHWFVTEHTNILLYGRQLQTNLQVGGNHIGGIA